MTSSRVYPSSYNVKTIGPTGDYATFELWRAAKVDGADYVLAGAGEVGRFQAGITHNETAGAGGTFNLSPANDSSTLFAVVDTDLSNPATVNLTQNNLVSDNIYGFRPSGYSSVFNLQVSLTTTAVVGAGKFAYAIAGSENSKMVGNIITDITGGSINAGAYVVGLWGDTNATLINNGIHSGCTFPGAGLGIYAYTTGAGSSILVYNNTSTNASTAYAFVYNTAAGGAIALTNNIGQNGVAGDFLNFGGGAGATLTTNADGAGITMKADGVHIDQDDAGNGTDLSAVFDDDIDGATIVAGQWYRGCDYAGAAPVTSTTGLIGSLVGNTVTDSVGELIA